MRKICSSGSVGAPGRQLPGSTRTIGEGGEITRSARPPLIRDLYTADSLYRSKLSYVFQMLGEKTKGPGWLGASWNGSSTGSGDPVE